MKPINILNLAGTNLLTGSWQIETNGIPGVEPDCTYTVQTENTEGFIQIQLD